MATGNIKRLVLDRGYGFISADDGGDYFFHRNSLDKSLPFDTLAGGERVTFDVERGEKGPRAANVKPA